MEGGHGLVPAVVPKAKLVKMDLELGAADPVVVPRSHCCRLPVARPKEGSESLGISVGGTRDSEEEKKIRNLPRVAGQAVTILTGEVDQ